MTISIEATFDVTGFESQPTHLKDQTAAPAGRARIEKTFTGDVSGRSEAEFVGAQSATHDGAATYVALENFKGSLLDKSGAFSFAHMSTIINNEVIHAALIIVPGSGTEELAGITGSGAISIDEDGTHRISLEYELN